ncbi:hypothetical protein OGAPHI_007377 [Ogataea philodendri]|uniref:Phospholipid/glycerol acyltransferase domain-containing protein n=1 Tax=Ogataea philodendri TaxID=1378263 RepID=A0A9P8NVJ5_9ASCO|nr:uncharacterized protein OGAPHI_007377 [Ogataea philodendri]KAH3660172.1 hypothetical protein OGAPHI_007377 [Ogataea philodendri]
MEKFNDWRDKGTGISPFMPIPPPNSSVVVKYIAGPVFALLKLGPAVVLGLLLTITWPVSFLFKPLLRLFLLLIFNVSEVEFTADGVKRSNTKQINAKRPKNGQIVFVNFSSPLDSLVLFLSSTSSSTVFLFADSKGNLRQLSGLIDSFKFALSQPIIYPASDKGISDLSKYKSKVVFIFAEGTTSNNRGVLAFPDIDFTSIVAKKDSFHFRAVSIKSTPSSLISTPIPQSLSSFMYGLLSHLSYDVKYKLKVFDLPDLKPATIREKLSNFGTLKLTGQDLDINKKLSFITTYNKVNKRL